jgi:hypothetical protein
MISIIQAIKNFICRLCGIDAGGLQHVEHIDNLWHEFIPKLQWEAVIGCRQHSNECIFECLDDMFGSVDSVIMWFYQLQFALFFSKKLLDVFEQNRTEQLRKLGNFIDYYLDEFNQNGVFICHKQ